MFKHNHWVNRYREQLSPKGDPFYKQLGILEADITANAGTSEKTQSQADSNAAETVQPNPAPTPVAPTPQPQKPIDPNKATKEAAIAPAQKGDARVQRIFEYCHKVMLAKDNAFDAYVNSAIKNFDAEDIDNALQVRKEEKSSAFDRAFASKVQEIEERRRDELRKNNANISDKQIRIRLDELKKDIEDEAVTAAKAAETNRNDQTTSRRTEGQPIKQGLGIFGKNAESIRLAKAIMVRIYSFEILSTILGNQTSLGQANKYVQKTMQDLVDEAKEKIAEKKAEDEAEKQTAEKKSPGEEAIKNPATNPEGITLKLEDIINNFDLNTSYFEDEYIKIKIDDEISVIIEANVIEGTARTIGNLFSKMGAGQHSSMVKFASQDKKKIIGSMIKWFFTKQSFSTRVFGGTNAMAVVDGLTQGYLHAINNAAYKSMKDYFMLNIPQNMKVLSDEEFEKALAKNAGKFQLNQGVINEMITSILEAFIARERL